MVATDRPLWLRGYTSGDAWLQLLQACVPRFMVLWTCRCRTCARWESGRTRRPSSRATRRLIGTRCARRSRHDGPSGPPKRVDTPVDTPPGRRTLACRAKALRFGRRWPSGRRRAPGERRLERLKCDKISQFCDRTHYDVTRLGPDITLCHTSIHSLIHSPKCSRLDAPPGFLVLSKAGALPCRFQRMLHRVENAWGVLRNCNAATPFRRISS